MKVILWSVMRQMGLEPTEDLKMGRKMVQDKIKTDGISEERFQIMLDRAASELAKSGKLGSKSSGSQRKFADGSFKDINIRFVNFDKHKNPIAESSKQLAIRCGFFTS